jgi:hypothetical protein
MGRMNWSQISSRDRMHRQGVEDIKGKLPVSFWRNATPGYTAVRGIVDLVTTRRFPPPWCARRRAD